jgi:acyl-coenzyme A thioesterase PaaI-like protein
MDPTSLLRLWRRLHRLPGGSWLFSRLVNLRTPYTASIRARIAALGPGRATVVMRDRRRVRNPFRSVHAVALANLGELASGLATLTAMPAGARGIPTALHVEYLKKARGTLTATSDLAVPEPGLDGVDHAATAEIRDTDGDVVARVEFTWRIAPR